MANYAMLRNRGWNRYVDLLLITGYAMSGKDTFANDIVSGAICKKSNVLDWHYMSNEINLSLLFNDYKHIRQVSIADMVKMEYANKKGITLNNFYDREAKELYRVDLGEYANSKKRIRGDNVWIERAFQSLDFKPTTIDRNIDIGKTLLLVTDWRFYHELMYVKELKIEGIIGDYFSSRMYRAVPPKYMDKILDDYKSDIVLLGTNNVSTIENDVNNLCYDFPQYKEYNNLSKL